LREIGHKAEQSVASYRFGKILAGHRKILELSFRLWIRRIATIVAERLGFRKVGATQLSIASRPRTN
jgi:hypothetical protein